MSRLAISPATFKRDLVKLREQMHVPVRFDRATGRYRIELAEPAAAMPALWFSADEVLGLLTMQRVLAELAPGTLGAKLRPLGDRLNQLMATSGLPEHAVANRLHVVPPEERGPAPALFVAAASATLARKRMKVTHSDRQTGEVQECEISPQRLVHYRDNWYIDAWCHQQESLRSFPVSWLGTAQAMDEDAIDIEPEVVAQKLGPKYA
ncbi:helix-turn-helix transcriptional regulator [Caenimonas koreensis]|uniref:helix-turn-helix transcriptional regulator n=1 Tax=Caenimonas koreensis TaxID=367474 RepID=UPI003783BBF6